MDIKTQEAQKDYLYSDFPFEGMITKRLGKITYGEWLDHTTEFLNIFASAYKPEINHTILGQYNIFGGDSFGELPVSYWEETAKKATFFRLDNMKINGNIKDKLEKSINPQFFDKNLFRIQIEPPIEESSSHSTCGRITKESSRSLSLFVQGESKLVKAFDEYFSNKPLKERVVYKLKKIYP